MQEKIDEFTSSAHSTLTSINENLSLTTELLRNINSKCNGNSEIITSHIISKRSSNIIYSLSNKDDNMEEKMSIDPANCTTSEYPYTPRGNIMYLGSDEDKISSASPDKSPN